MSTSTPAAADPAVAGELARGRLSDAIDSLVRGIGPIALALVACGGVLLALGRDPVAFYGDVLTAGILRPSGLQDSITRTAPILLMSAGLIVVFRANLWNLGSDGQYLLGAALVAGTGPALMAAVPAPVGWLALSLLAMAAGAVWTLIPALMKARYGMNEIITTLMMTFIGIGLANILVKGPFKGTAMVPQTNVIPVGQLLATIPGTRIPISVIVALLVVVLVHLALTRTSFGTRLDVLGANPRAAIHLGIDVPRLTVVAFAISGALIGLAAAMDILGIFGYMRADWNPAFGLKVIPLVFLARLNALAVIPFAVFFSVISIGGEYAAREAQLPTDFLLLVVGLILAFVVVTQYLSDKHARGEPIFRSRRRAGTA